MNLLQLQYFRTIAQLENLSRAAEVLCVAQPNLSVSMKRLEEELGVPLFDRRRGRIRLTQAGRLFLGHIEATLDRLDEGIAGVRESARVADGQVCVISSIADLMGLLLREYLGRGGQVSFRQLSARNSEIPERVLRGDADFGFLFGGCGEQMLEYTLLDSCERVVMLSKDHPLAAKDIIGLEDLAQERLVCNNSRDDAVLLADLVRTASFRGQAFYECDDNRAEVSMLLCGGGVSVSPLSNYLKLMNSDPDLPLTCRRVRERLPEARIGMIRRAGDRLSAPAIDFCRLVSEFFVTESELAAAYTRTLPERV